MKFTLAALADELEAQAARADQEDQSLIQEDQMVRQIGATKLAAKFHRESGA